MESADVNIGAVRFEDVCAVAKAARIQVGHEFAVERRHVFGLDIPQTELLHTGNVADEAPRAQSDEFEVCGCVSALSGELADFARPQFESGL